MIVPQREWHGLSCCWQEALIHSTLPWTVETERRTLFAKFAPHGSSFNPILFEPEECKPGCFQDLAWFDRLIGRSLRIAGLARYSDVDPRIATILSPPNRIFTGDGESKVAGFMKVASGPARL